MSLSDRIVFMSGGRVVETGTPEDIYRRPRMRSTAEFLGIANMVEGRVVAVGPEALSIESKLGRIDLDEAFAAKVGDEVFVCLRPEDIRLGTVAPGKPNGLAGTVRHAAYLGSITDYIVESNGNDVLLRVHVPGPTAWRIGDTARIELPRFAAVIRRGTVRDPNPQ